MRVCLTSPLCRSHRLVVNASVLVSVAIFFPGGTMTGAEIVRRVLELTSVSNVCTEGDFAEIRGTAAAIEISLLRDACLLGTHMRRPCCAALAMVGAASLRR